MKHLAALTVAALAVAGCDLAPEELTGLAPQMQHNSITTDASMTAGFPEFAFSFPVVTPEGNLVAEQGVAGRIAQRTIITEGGEVALTPEGQVTIRGTIPEFDPTTGQFTPFDEGVVHLTVGCIFLMEEPLPGGGTFTVGVWGGVVTKADTKRGAIEPGNIVIQKWVDQGDGPNSLDRASPAVFGGTAKKCPAAEAFPEFPGERGAIKSQVLG